MDSSLLPTISFPAFATHEDLLYNEVKSNITGKLKGNYGFKRFIRDGYKTVVENNTKRFYDKGEIKNFENIECEWPLFYIFMIIDGVFKSLPDQIAEYQELLKQRMFLDKHGGRFYQKICLLNNLYGFCFAFCLDPVIPMYFYVPKTSVENERNEPHTVSRKSSPENNLFLWNQAMFILAQLLTAGLLHINELDPIRRYLPSYNRPKKGGRYSAFQVI